MSCNKLVNYDMSLAMGKCHLNEIAVATMLKSIGLLSFKIG